jgi:hypothetical protein
MKLKETPLRYLRYEGTGKKNFDINFLFDEFLNQQSLFKVSNNSYTQFLQNMYSICEKWQKYEKRSVTLFAQIGQ